MTPQETIALIYFFYGLAFFSMGLAIIIEIGHATNPNLRHALLPLAIFGLLHGAHEWLEMFQILHILPGQDTIPVVWEAIRLGLLSFSFLSLAAFGAFLIFRDETSQRLSLLLPLGLAAVWAFGLSWMSRFYSTESLWDVADVWTRYVLAIPAALLASIGLVAQQREFRKAGLAQFGRDSLWAAIALFWYGLVGQSFTRASALPPSNVINNDLFIELFGFPVQLLRAAAALLTAIFVMRFMRSFEVETRRQIAALQEDRLVEAQRREALRGEMLRRIVAAQEAERQRVARELHDETGQSLTAIGLGLRGVSASLGQDNQKSSKNLRHLESMVDHSLRELQRLIGDLRPSHLDDLGLAAALRWYASEVEQRASFRVKVDVLGEARPLPSEMNIALFRIGQEALTNVIKHAGAENVSVELAYQDEGVRLIVTDDGIGFSPELVPRSNRVPYGLVGMRERALLLDGTFSVDSSPGKGTSIEVMIPYPKVAFAKGDNHAPAAGR